MPNSELAWATQGGGWWFPELMQQCKTGVGMVRKQKEVRMGLLGVWREREEEGKKGERKKERTEGRKK